MVADSHKKTPIPPGNVDELLKRAKALQSRSEKSAGESEVSSKGKGVEEAIEAIKSLNAQVSYIGRFLSHSKEACLGFYRNLFLPFWRVFSPPFVFVARIYKKLWQRFAFYTDPQSGERIFSRKRSSAVMAVTLLFVLALTPTGIGSALRFVSVEPVLDSVLMLTSMKTETFYLNNSQEVDPEGNIHSVRGCRIEGLCGEKDAAYFRVLPRLSHDVWKLIRYGNPIYVPDHVVAPIAPGVNKCAVTYYGYRMTSSWLSRLLRSLELYPTMLEASCRHESVNNSAALHE